MTTRAQVELILNRRTRRLSRFVRFDVTTVDGTNTDYADAIASTILAMGGAVADPTDPTSAEVDAAASGSELEFFDRAELRHLQNIAGNWADPNEQEGINKQEWGNLLKLVQERIKALQDRIDDEWGPPATSNAVACGMIDLDFQQRSDDTVIYT